MWRTWRRPVCRDAAIDEAHAAACRQRTRSGVAPDIGCGEDVSIRELSELVREVVGYAGKVEWDSGKPDGMRASFWTCPG